MPHNHGPSYPVPLDRDDLRAAEHPMVVSMQAHRTARGWVVDTVGPLGHLETTPLQARLIAEAYLSAARDCEERERAEQGEHFQS